MDTNKHDIIVTEAFRAALLRVKIAASEGRSEGACLSAGLNKVDTDWFNRNYVTFNPNDHWSAHHLHHLRLHIHPYIITKV